MAKKPAEYDEQVMKRFYHNVWRIASRKNLYQQDEIYEYSLLFGRYRCKLSLHGEYEEDRTVKLLPKSSAA